MGEDLLVGQALLNIHRHRDIQVDEVIDMFVASKQEMRGLCFIIFYIMHNNKNEPCVTITMYLNYLF